jgi:DNA replication licensing factor MCM4
VSLYYPDDIIAGMKEAQKQQDLEQGIASTVDQQFLKEYILFARTHVFPEISLPARELLVQYYLEMRGLGNRGTKTITATPRQLESLIRLSEALAKMRLSSVVTEADVHEAMRLMKVATQTAATDPRTGTIDMDLITTGRSAMDRDLVLQLAEELRTLLLKQVKERQLSRVTLGQLRAMLLQNMRDAQGGGGSNSYNSASNQQQVSSAELEEAVRELESDGFLTFNERTQAIVMRVNN